MARKRDALLQAVELVEGQLAELRERQQAAFDSLTMSYKGVSERTRAALAQHADTAVAACDAMEEQVRTLQLGVGVLDEQARTIDGILADPNLTPERWREPAVYQSLKRLFAVLVAGAELRAADSGGYVVASQVYRVPQSRENGTTESAWESNPPARLVTAPTSFEDQDSHRATSALAQDCRAP